MSEPDDGEACICSAHRSHANCGSTDYSCPCLSVQRGESAEAGGIGLTDHEAAALARRVLAEWCRHGERPEWEDLPMLGEYAFERLCDAIVDMAEALDGEADGIDRAHGIDSGDLLSRARDDAHIGRSVRSGGIEANRTNPRSGFLGEPQ